MTTGSGTRSPGTAAGPRSPSDTPFLADLDHAFRQACEAGDPSDTWLRLAGHAIRLRFASPAMAREITPALDHLALGAPPAGEPDLEIRIWDDASTGTVTPVPDPPDPAAAEAVPQTGPDGQDATRGDDEAGGHVFLYRFRDARAAYEPSWGLVSALAGDSLTGYLRAASANRLSLRERASPCRTILAWWARRHGLQIAHASAVGTAAGGVLLVGRAGSGKSTTALACLGSGLGYTADDCCLVETGEAPTVFGLYATAKVARDRAAWFPPVEAEIRAAPAVLDDEVLLHLADRHGDALQPAFPLRAVLVPEIGATEPRLEPCSAGLALAALAPSTIFQFPGSDAGTLGRLADVVRRVPCHRLRLGPDPARLPGLIRALIEEATP